MQPDEAEDWLAVAVGTVGHYPGRVLSEACQEARRRCSHHAQIVPAVIDEAEPLLAAERRRIQQEADYVPRARQIEAPRPPKLTQADVDAMPEHLIRLGLAAGFLARDESGGVVLVPE